MAPRTMSEPMTILRVTTQRLTATPAWQLPHVAPYLADSIISCEGVLTILENQGKDESESAVLAHKLKTQISSLLQDKNPQSRWAAIILVKAIIEFGGWNTLHGCGAWVRGLLGILGKPDPQTTKELCIITLTRIFILLGDHQSLVREIVTPSLPGFITSCIRIIENHKLLAEERKMVGSSLMSTILYAFCKLIPYHPTLFRPFVVQIRSLILPLIASTPSNYGLESPSNQQEVKILASLNFIAGSARKLYVLLSNCAAKNTSSEEWAKSVHTTISMLHGTADIIFRAVIEDWDPTPSRIASTTRSVLNSAETASDFEDNPLGLPSWKGIHAGMERLDGLLHLLQEFLLGTTPMAVEFPVGAVFHAVNRILSVYPPLDDEKDGNLRINPEIGRDEREGLWTTLPNLHVSGLEVLLLIVLRFGEASSNLIHNILEQVLWVFEREKSNHNVRKIIYEIVSKIITLHGLSLPKFVSTLFSKCIKSCCEDLLSSKLQPFPVSMNSTSFAKKPSTNGTPINADSFLKATSNSSKSSLIEPSEVQKSAAILLPLTLTNLPNGFIHSSLRAQIERTAILTRDKHAMLASILTPAIDRGAGQYSSSIMPLFARQFPESLEAEALIRPRMPVLQPRTHRGDLSSEEDAEIPEPDNRDHRITSEYSSNVEIPDSNPLKNTSTPKIDSIPENNNPPSTGAQSSIPITDTNTTTTIPETLKTQPQSPTRKRDRETSPTNPDMIPQTLPPVPEDQPNSTRTKRPRIDSPPRDDTNANTAPSREEPVPPVSKYAGLGGEGSDSSDFEMPVLDLTMDTEDEDEDEDDDDDGEKEDEE